MVASVATLPLPAAVGDRGRPPGGVVDRVLRTGRPARIDGYEDEPGSPGDQLNALGYGGAAAAPIFVEGRLWGVIRSAWSKGRSVSPGSEDRLLQFSELIATALANAEAREELRRVAEEQAALRRVATLVARGEPPSAVFAAVAAEAGRVISVAGVALVGRYDLDEERSSSSALGALRASLASWGAVWLSGVAMWPLLCSNATSPHALIEFPRTTRQPQRSRVTGRVPRPARRSTWTVACGE